MLTNTFHSGKKLKLQYKIYFILYSLSFVGFLKREVSVHPLVCKFTSFKLTQALLLVHIDTLELMCFPSQESLHFKTFK